MIFEYIKIYIHQGNIPGDLLEHPLDELLLTIFLTEI